MKIIELNKKKGIKIDSNTVKECGLPIFLALMILVLSVIPGNTADQLGMNKEAYHVRGHFIMYTLLCLSLFRLWKSEYKSFGITIFYGIVLEFLQKLVPGRACELKDVLINSFGAFVALIIIWKRSLLLPMRLKNWLEK